MSAMHQQPAARAARGCGGFSTCTWRVLALLGAGAALALGPAQAAGLNVKMATLAPENSPYDKILKDMGKEWEAQTAGRVTLTVYPGGVAGDEPDILRKMKLGQYHASAISVSGLVDISDDFTVFEVPLFYRSFDEMAHVLDALSPTLEARLEEKGFVLLGWGYVGWVYFFTTKPAHTVDDMKSLKIFTWAGDDAMVQWWRRHGFNPVSLAATDIVTGLQTGLIEALSAPPLYVMQVQLFRTAKYMADLGLAPMMGAILITKTAWSRIDEADRAKLKAAGGRAEARVFRDIPKLDQTAIKLMATQGLEVIPIEGTPASKEWIAEAERFADEMRGDIVPVPIFDEAFAARVKYREAQAAKGEPSAPAAESGDRP